MLFDFLFTLDDEYAIELMVYKLFIKFMLMDMKP